MTTSAALLATEAMLHRSLDLYDRDGPGAYTAMRLVISGFGALLLDAGISPLPETLAIMADPWGDDDE